MFLVIREKTSKLNEGGVEREREREIEREREHGEEGGRKSGAESKEEKGEKEFKNLPIGSSGVHIKCMTSKSEG